MLKNRAHSRAADTGYPDLDGQLEGLKAELKEIFEDPLSHSLYEVNQNYEAQRACYDEAERRDACSWRAFAAIVFVLICVLGILVIALYARLAGSTSQEPRRAAISDACVVERVPHGAIGLRGPSWTGLLNGLIGHDSRTVIPLPHGTSSPSGGRASRGLGKGRGSFLGRGTARGPAIIGLLRPRDPHTPFLTSHRSRRGRSEAAASFVPMNGRG
jgi:hypothetical protein